MPIVGASISSSTPSLEQGLQRLGFDAFRPGQREAIETLFERRRLLLVAPTGGGKSLTYQLPATLLPGTTLVVSPLVALMNDQVDGLRQQGVSATYLAATLPGDEVRTRMAGIARGEFKLVYVAPERLAFGGFRGLLGSLDISLVAVDEAHCISEWGHDFRPEYLQIGSLLRDLDPPLAMACTATATPIVRDEILSRLGLSPETPQLVQGFARPNLALRAEEVGSAKDRRLRVDALLHEALGSPHEASGTAIVYAPTRKSTEEEATRLTTQGWRAAAYHAGMAGLHRDRVQAAFMQDALDVVVATNAFGMGIDRSDVRAVVHLAPPGSIEAYYQEVGRAGRDGVPAFGLMLVSPNDMPLRRRLLERSTDDNVPDPAVVEHKWNLFLELMRWAEGGSCRHDAILRYFGDEAEALQGCGRCDVCQSLGQDPASEEQVRLIVQKALSAVARVHGKFGLTAAAKLLRGAEDPRLHRAGLDQTRTFGILSEYPEEWIVKLLRRSVTAGWVDFHGREHPVVFLTAEGKAAMQGQRRVRLLLPPRSVGSGVRPRGDGRRAAKPAPELDPQGMVMFEALRRHRLERSKTDGVAPYVVASDRTLRDVALLRPRTLEELALAHGIGPAKLERYGAEMLAVVAQAREATMEIS